MPDSFDWFFENYSSTIVSYSTKPDEWKSSDPNEGYRHYYDYDKYVTHTYTEQQQPSYGVLPWTLEDNFHTFVQYLKNKDWTSAAQLAGVISHYVGDASMPLHATSDYWLGGAHTDYETEVNNRLSEMTISSYVPHRIENVFEAAMAMLAESYWFTDNTHTDNTKLSYWLAQGILWNDTIKNITENRLNAAAQLLSNIWYTAMIQAGTPSLIAPENCMYLFDTTPTFVWTSWVDSSKATYQIQIGGDDNFSSSIYFAEDLTDNAHTLPDENALALGKYYWRVRAKYGAGNFSDWSAVWSFSVYAQTNWMQTDWVGGPTEPELQVGTWTSAYDNFYDNENVDWSQVGKIRLKSFPGSQQVTENVTPPRDDSYACASDSNRNYGTSANIYVGYSSGAQRGYLKFDFSSIPSNRTIIQAKLWVYNYSVSKGGAYVKVERVDDDSWTESGITWDTQPARTGVLVSSQSVSSGTTWYSWTSSALTSFVADEHVGDKIASLALIDAGENTSPNHYARFNSKEYSSGTYAPKLEVTYLNALYENGWFESSVFDAGEVVDWKLVSWSESKPSGTNVIVRLRTGNDNDPYDGGWSGWYQHSNGAENTLLPNGRYVQYRVELSTTDGTKTPEFSEIILSYESDTTPPPAPTLVRPANGENISDNTPNLDWNPVSDNSPPVLYRVWVDNDPNFSSIDRDSGWITADQWEVAPALAGGVWYWKVQAKDNAGNMGDWSAVWQFTVVSKAPPTSSVSPSELYLLDGQWRDLFVTVHGSQPGHTYRIYYRYWPICYPFHIDEGGRPVYVDSDGRAYYLDSLDFPENYYPPMMDWALWCDSSDVDWYEDYGIAAVRFYPVWGSGYYQFRSIAIDGAGNADWQSFGSIPSHDGFNGLYNDFAHRIDLRVVEQDLGPSSTHVEYSYKVSCDAQVGIEEAHVELQGLSSETEQWETLCVKTPPILEGVVVADIAPGQYSRVGLYVYAELEGGEPGAGLFTVMWNKAIT